MKTVITKIPNEDYEKLREACSSKGMSLYECVRYLVYRFLKENGYETSAVPLELRVEKLEREIEALKKQVEALMSKVSTKVSMDRFLKKR